MLLKKRVVRDNGKMHVTFSIPASIWADTICLVGDFNNWSTSETPLQLDGEHWSVTLELDTDQVYQYRYLVNNTEWMSDWNVDGSVSQAGIDTSIVITQLPEEGYPVQPRNTAVLEPGTLRLLAPPTSTALPRASSEQ